MRVASLQPSVTVVLQRLGLLDHMVACTKYCADVVPELRHSPVRILSDSWSADAAEIQSVHPDLVIAAVPYRLESLAEILKSGVRVLALAPKSLADIYGDIGIIAAAMGHPELAHQVIHDMQEGIARIRLRAAGCSTPLVFCEEWGNPILRSQPWVGELVEAAGGVFQGTPGTQAVADDIRDLDPEVMVFSWCGAGDRVPLEKMVEKRGWQNTRAARENRVYCIRDEWLNTPAPTLLSGLEALLWALHPELISRPPGIRAIRESV